MNIVKNNRSILNSESWDKKTTAANILFIYLYFWSRTYSESPQLLSPQFLKLFIEINMYFMIKNII